MGGSGQAYSAPATCTEASQVTQASTAQAVTDWCSSNATGIDLK